MDTELSWFALRVTSNYEFMVRGILRRRGLIAHAKTETRLRRKTAKDTKRKEREFPIPGYCFVGLDAAGPSPWALVHCYHMIKSVVSQDGRAALLDATKLRAFLGYNDFNAPEHFKYLRTRQEQFQIGDELRIANPAFEELKLPLVDVQEGEAIFHLLLLGKVQELRVPVEQVYKAA